MIKKERQSSFLCGRIVALGYMLLLGWSVGACATSDVPVCVFDLHGVLMESDTAEGAKSFCRNVVSIAADFGKLLWAHPRQPAAWRDALEPAANCQKPVDAMWTLIRELRAKGVPVVLFSNIRPHTYDQLRRRFPEEFALFDRVIIVGPETGWRTKQDDAFYDAVERSVAEMLPGKRYSIVYVDDTRAYVLRGRQRGWHALTHVDAESTIEHLKLFVRPEPCISNRK